MVGNITEVMISYFDPHDNHKIEKTSCKKTRKIVW